MLSVLRGVLPCPPLVWAGPSSAVTGETGGSVASPQKSSELNKPPNKHTDFISFSVCLRAAPKEVPLPHRKRRGSRYTKLLWQCANLPFQLLDSTIFCSCSCITLLSFSHLLSSCRSACANVFTLCFIAHLSALIALRSLFLSVCLCLCSFLLSLSSHLLLGLVVMPTCCCPIALADCFFGL